MEEPKGPGGRPSLLNDKLREQMLRMYEKGLTDLQVADIVGVSYRTLMRWKSEDEEFRQSIKETTENADELVEKSLRSRAIGYSHKATKINITKDGEVIETEYIEHYPPDPTSMIFWLKNRQPQRWREKQEIEQTNKNIEIKIDKDDEQL
jgi:transcriptional regulator with XRE-family HTH domain